MAPLVFLVLICCGASILGPLSVLIRRRVPGRFAAALGAALGALLSAGIAGLCLGREEIGFTDWSAACLMASLGFLAGRLGFSAASRLSAQLQHPPVAPIREFALSLFAWVVLFELPVILLSVLYRLLHGAGL